MARALIVVAIVFGVVFVVSWGGLIAFVLINERRAREHERAIELERRRERDAQLFVPDEWEPR